MIQKKNKIELCNIIYLVVLFILMFCFGCGIFASDKTDIEVYNDNILKTVEIRVTDDEVSWGYGTGCVISDDGQILTNRHMVVNSNTNLEYSKVEIRFANSEDFEQVSILQISSDNDLALLKCNKNNLPYFELASSVKNGEEIYTIGNPNGFGLSFTKGNISSSSRNVEYNGEIMNVIQTSLIINEGNSGGPVFNKEGRLLGLISFRLKDKMGVVIQGVSFAVPVSAIKEFVLQG